MLSFWSISGPLVPASDSTPDVQGKKGMSPGERSLAKKIDLDIGQHNKDKTE